MIKHQTSQTNNSIYLYKKGFRYELFTLVMQGNATLESGVEHIMSTVGPFSCFAATALLAEHKTIKDVHQFLDRLFIINAKTNNIHINFYFVFFESSVTSLVSKQLIIPS